MGKVNIIQNYVELFGRTKVASNKTKFFKTNVTLPPGAASPPTQ